MKKKVAIIGAGLTGLVAGYRLCQAGYKVTIFERNDDIGGLMGGFKINGTSLEKAYHHIFKTDTDIIGLVKELGLEDKLKWHESSIAVYSGGNLYPFVTPLDLLMFKPLGLIGKFRTGLISLWLQKDNNWQKYISITAKDWMKKTCGTEAYKVIWEPLLKGKFHDYYDKVSMAWLWARIHTRAGSKDKDGKEYLGYFDGGFRVVADKLADKIKANGGEIRLNQEVDFNKVEKNYDKVIYTGAAKGIDYLGAVCVVFTSKQSLSKYYWHNINDNESPFLCFIQHTNLIDKKSYQNENVYYMGTYIPHDHKFFSSDDKVVKKAFFEYLHKVFPKFDQKKIHETFVFKLKNAQHIVTTDYPTKIPPYKISEKIYQSNFAQIFPEDRGTNFAVREGNRIAEMIN
jgi:protoporphyrinogen oxidase